MRSLAEQYLKGCFESNWSPEAATQQYRCDEEMKPSQRKTGKKRKAYSLVASLLSMDAWEEEEEEMDKEDDDMDQLHHWDSDVNWNKYSEVERYLQLPQLPTTTEDGKDVDILAWWRKQLTNLPYLSKMARQYLALPCSSAGGKCLFHNRLFSHNLILLTLIVGPERLFSAAGKMHDSLKKDIMEESLKHRLMIHQNT
mgnify:CR=1 FL=1